MLEFILEKTTKNFDLYKQVDGGINKLYLPKQSNPPKRIGIVPQKMEA